MTGRLGKARRPGRRVSHERGRLAVFEAFRQLDRYPVAAARTDVRVTELNGVTAVERRDLGAGKRDLQQHAIDFANFCHGAYFALITSTRFTADGVATGSGGRSNVLPGVLPGTPAEQTQTDHAATLTRTSCEYWPGGCPITWTPTAPCATDGAGTGCAQSRSPSARTGPRTARSTSPRGARGSGRPCSIASPHPDPPTAPATPAPPSTAVTTRWKRSPTGSSAVGTSPTAEAPRPPSSSPSC